MLSDRPSAIDEAYFAPANLGRLGRAARGAQLLSEELWAELHAELGARSRRDAAGNAGAAAVQRTAALAERIADVAAAMALLATTERRGRVTSGDGAAAGAPAEEPRVRPAGQAQLNAVLIDEQGDAVPGPGPAGSTATATRPPEPQAKPRPRPWDSPPTPPSQAVPAPSQAELLDENGHKESPAWSKLIAGALERFERDRLPFAVLLIEVLEAEQLRSGLRLAELPQLLREIENASTRALDAIGARSTASVALEGATRLWLQVPEMDRLEAHALVERLAGAAEPAPGSPNPAERYFATLSSRRPSSWTAHNGKRLELAIGTAVCPDDGGDLVALVSHARTNLASVHDVKPSSAKMNGPG